MLDRSPVNSRSRTISSTDTGHVGANGALALGHPEKFIDFAWRSEHEMTLAGKAIVKAFYRRAPAFSYWNGCSTGGGRGWPRPNGSPTITTAS
jgi:tannase/feruloyl esterase